MRTSYWALLAGALVVGCTGGGDRAQRAPDSAGMMGHMDSGAGMGGMPMQGMRMMGGMRVHMDSMMQASPQQMQAMMATHQQMMSRLLDGMGADMRGMRMSGSPEWTALTDSVKQDLAELPGLRGQALSTRMRGHVERVRRLMAMHEQMMGK